MRGVVGSSSRDGALRRRCRRLVDGLELPRPFEAAAFIGTLALERGRRIELIPVSARPNLPCGLVITMAEADLILYSADTSPLHRQHILLHEAAHLLCGHVDEAARGTVARADADEGADAQGAGADAGLGARRDGDGPAGVGAGISSLLPHLPAELVRGVLGRTVYSEPQEREAELVASLILYRAARDDAPPARLPGPPSRLETIFGLPEF